LGDLQINCLGPQSMEKKDGKRVPAPERVSGRKKSPVEFLGKWPAGGKKRGILAAKINAHRTNGNRRGRNLRKTNKGMVGVTYESFVCERAGDKPGVLEVRKT